MEELVARLRAAGCVYAEEEAALLLAADGPLEALVARRLAGEPLEYVLGWASFDGVRVAVTPGVFVPRARSAVLVDAVRRRVPRGARVLDLCCGTGALGAALADEYDVWAADADPVAVACARANLGADRVFAGDLYDALPDVTFAAIVANAPYVPSAEIALMPSEARDHEAPLALDGGADGLDVQRRVIAGSSAWLVPGGLLAVETSRRQATTTLALFEAAGFAAEVVRDDERDGTAVVGRSPRQEFMQ